MHSLNDEVLGFRLSYRDMLVIIAIILFAFFLRTVVIFDRAAADPRFTPIAGMDQEYYIRQGNNIASGAYPYAVYTMQPAVIYDFFAIERIVGYSVPLLRLAIAAFDAVAAGWLAGAAWLLVRRRAAGYIVALLYALYPVAIFYGTTLLIAPHVTFTLGLFLFFVLWQHRQPTLRKTLILGVLAGWLLALRLNLAPIAGIWLLWYLWQHGHQRLQHALVFLGTIAAVIAPFTLWNAYITGGDFILITRVGSFELYMGNNRDAAGTASDGRAPAILLVDDGDYLSALIKDIQLDPLRFAGLMVRKAATYWSNAEPNSNIDYVRNGENLSPLLRSIPIDFTMIALIGLLGVALLWVEQRPLAWLFLGLLLALFVGGIAAHTVGRIRHPVSLPLMVCGAYALVRGWEMLRARKAVTWKPYLLPTAIALIWSFAPYLFLTNPPQFPPKRILHELPADARPVGAVFNDELRLVGWRPVSLLSPESEAGWITPQQSYIIELFWEVLQSTETRYEFTLTYEVDGQRVAGYDRFIGGTSYPPTPTYMWQVGDIYSEIVGFRPPANAPLLRSGRVFVDVYTTEGDLRDPSRPIFEVAITEPQGAADISLTTLAVYPPAIPEELPPVDTALDSTFTAPNGDSITLHGYTLLNEATAGGTMTLEMVWSAQTEIALNYNMFIHVMNEDDELVTQFDGLPVADIFTSNWRPAYPLVGQIAVPMPQQAGAYRLYVGLYDAPAASFRLDAGTPDNRLLLAEVVIE